MILIGLGGNLPSAAGAPPETFLSAIAALGRHGVRTLVTSPVYRSPPWPSGSGPDFYNQAIAVTTLQEPAALMATLLKVEAAHGRLRREKWGPRTLDLDLLDYQGMIVDAEHLSLPHAWMGERAFVLKPVRDIAPDWRHPETGLSLDALLEALADGERDACQRV